MTKAFGRNRWWMKNAWRSVAAVAVAVAGAVGAQAAEVIYVTADTYIEAANPLTSHGSESKLISNENSGIGAASKYGLMYFDIPEQTLADFSAAWDAAGGNAFSQLKAVLSVNSVGRSSSTVSFHKSTFDWHGFVGENVAWADWQEGDGPVGLLGNNFDYIASDKYFDGKVRGNESGVAQVGVMNTSGGNQGMARTILDWAAGAGVGPTTPYTNNPTDANPMPNYGLVAIPNPGNLTVEYASREYAADHGPQYMPKLVLYREPGLEDQIRVTDGSTQWDVYQSPIMTPTDGVGGTAPHYPVVLLPAADGNGKQWYESGFDMSGAGWNANTDTEYNGVVGGQLVNNGGIYGWPGTNTDGGGVQTVLDKDFKGDPSGGGDATPRENGGVGNRLGYLYRTEFDAPDAADVDIMRLRMRTDGGARIYLNGVEVLDINFDDELYRSVNDVWGVPYEGQNDMTFGADAPGRASGETYEVYFDDPAFEGLLQETGNTLAVFSINRNGFDFGKYFWGMDYIDLLSNTDLFPDTSIDGDLDGDGFVGQSDLNLILGNWGQGVPPADPLADYDGSGSIGQGDLNAVLANWGQGTPPEVAAVPEPGSLLLMGLAGIGLAAYRIRGRKSKC